MQRNLLCTRIPFVNKSRESANEQCYQSREKFLLRTSLLVLFLRSLYTSLACPLFYVTEISTLKSNTLIIVDRLYETRRDHGSITWHRKTISPSRVVRAIQRRLSLREAETSFGEFQSVIALWFQWRKKNFRDCVILL